MIDILNIVAAIATIVFGAFGFLAPKYTMQALDLAATHSTMGASEMRASVGGLFVAMGLYCVIWGDSPTYFMLGVAYAGAAAGRAVSLVLDAPPRRKVLVFGGIEAALALWLIAMNGPG